MKYRILEKNGLYYPQYKECFVWYDMVNGVFTKKGLFVPRIAMFLYLEQAKEFIEQHKTRKCKKPIIHNVD
jgi:hypothetical protein